MPRKIPVRMCTGCRESRPKTELVRVVRGPDGTVSVDLTGKKSGRGAYICRRTECLKRAKKSRALQRALECEVTEEIFQRVEKELLEGEDDGDDE